MRNVGVALRKLCLVGSGAVMIGDEPYDAEAVFEASSAGRGVLSGGFTEDAPRGAGCFAAVGEISRLLGTLDDTKPQG